METQNENTRSSELEEIRQLMTPEKPTPEVLEFLNESALDSFARHLAIIGFQQDDNHIAVLAGVFRRFYDALDHSKRSSWLDRQNILTALNTFSDRLYHWSMTGEDAARDYFNVVGKKADEILKLDGPYCDAGTEN